MLHEFFSIADVTFHESGTVRNFRHLMLNYFVRTPARYSDQERHFEDATTAIVAEFTANLTSMGIRLRHLSLQKDDVARRRIMTATFGLLPVSIVCLVVFLLLNFYRRHVGVLQGYNHNCSLSNHSTCWHWPASSAPRWPSCAPTAC